SRGGDRQPNRQPRAPGVCGARLREVAVSVRVVLVLSLVALQAQAQVGDDWLRKALTSPRVGVRSAPSDAIYPPQTIELKFSHATHVDAGVDCQACHDAVDRSVKPS